MSSRDDGGDIGSILRAELIRTTADRNRLRAALNGLLPSKLCGEFWNLPGNETVEITITFDSLKAARDAIILSTIG